MNHHSTARRSTVDASVQSTIVKPPARINKSNNAMLPQSRFIPTGGMMLDCILAGTSEIGGWGRGRIVNIVGDKSSGKTLLAVEACANIALISPITNIRYIEAEAAFDADYGAVVGMPIGVHPIDTIRTVENYFDDLSSFCIEQKKNPFPAVHVLDSLDALSDDAEMKRKMGEGSYGMAKAKLMSETFRRQIKDIEAANVTAIIISQVRDKIGVMFGEKTTRTGGRALDFYASQVITLAEISKIKRTVSGIERPIGVEVRIRNRKNKLGPPYREAEQTMLFGYGIDDETSMLKFLLKTKVITSAVQWMDAVHAARLAKDRDRIKQINTELRKMVWTKWSEIEQSVAPIGPRKYD